MYNIIFGFTLVNIGSPTRVNLTYIHDTFPREHVSFEFRSLDTDAFDKKRIEVEITRVFVLAVILEMERV